MDFYLPIAFYNNVNQIIWYYHQDIPKISIENHIKDMNYNFYNDNKIVLVYDNQQNNYDIQNISTSNRYQEYINYLLVRK